MTQFDEDDDGVTIGGGRNNRRKPPVKKYEDEQLKLDLQTLMEVPAARRYFHHLMEFCGKSRTSFTGNSTTFFNEGARNVALKLEADLRQHSPANYLLMQHEAMKQDD